MYRMLTEIAPMTGIEASHFRARFGVICVKKNPTSLLYFPAAPPWLYLFCSCHEVERKRRFRQFKNMR